jgi:hypothetical protein
LAGKNFNDGRLADKCGWIVAKMRARVAAPAPAPARDENSCSIIGAKDMRLTIVA